MIKSLQIALIGCGLIGTRRAKEASQHPRTCLAMVADVSFNRCAQLAERYECRSVEGWKQVIEDTSIDAVIVSTPNGYTTEIALAALGMGKHVLVEKPPGRNLSEAKQMADAARRAGRILKIGFNHRYHPAIHRAFDLVSKGAIGGVINMRARYGHGGRPGYEKEWRGDPVLAGGGELTDQGVHIADLVHWFGGLPASAFALLQTAAWPIHPLEDNAFGLFHYANGVVASFHTSWTQWKNLFSLEIFGKSGSLSVEGLGGSYGTERLVIAIRNPKGGPPAMHEELFDGPDLSWKSEWADFVSAVTEGGAYWGTPEEGVAAMAMIDALYQSARSGAVALLRGTED